MALALTLTCSAGGLHWTTAGGADELGGALELGATAGDEEDEEVEGALLLEGEVDGLVLGLTEGEPDVRLAEGLVLGLVVEVFFLPPPEAHLVTRRTSTTSATPSTISRRRQ